MQETDNGSSDQRTISAWDALRARRAPHPPNPLRYAHTFWFAIALFALSIALTVAVVPARSIETDMLADAKQAKLDGFPDLPPGGATEKQINDWIEEWYTGTDRTFPGRDSITELSLRVGEYEDDSAILNLGVMGSLGALVFLAGLGFGKALNNLYALGYGASVLSPAWSFVSWLLPLLSFVLPWRVVTEVFECAWQKPGDAPKSTPRWPMYVAALWGAAFAGLWLLNPVAVNIFFRSGDIDQWISHIEWTARMLVWLPVPSFFTAVMLAVVAVRQHARYRDLDRRAAAVRQAAR